MSSLILLKNGTLLLHDANDVNIEPSSSDTTIIDCTDKIISPGFIDTHYHVCQTSLKATHPNHTLFDYFPTGNFIGSFLSADDTFWGQLPGALECIDTKEALRATVSSEIRSIFGYCPTARTFDQLATMNPFGPPGRVRLGFAFDGLYLPGEVLKEVYGRVRQVGAQLITSHSVYGVAFGAPQGLSAASRLDFQGLLGPDILLSHKNPTSEHTQLIRGNNVKVSSTPITELQMGHGNPVCLYPEYQQLSSLGIDCYSVCTPYTPTQMSTVLQWARAKRHEEFEVHGKWAKAVGSNVGDIFNLGTIYGARCIGMEKEIRGLAVDKKADIVIYDATSPGLVVAADRDPVAAIVLHSSIRDIDAVPVDWIIRKEGGKLKDVLITPDLETKEEKNGKTVRWAEIARRSRELCVMMDEKKKATMDEEVTRAAILEGFHLNVSAWAEAI
ncbi:hypothetical protein BDV28DRAFT_156522 [Aspergillus coremiiformis]|uniref:Uncharacterized protein n=1 Tax=Aspergillus coremiiformis TaxID=138285 RepID=A0A5N6ZA65_9EURO|nr:hypothetical protein BDV28DRAFT_156522 [Aspergillus coremiiformis]